MLRGADQNRLSKAPSTLLRLLQGHSQTQHRCRTEAHLAAGTPEETQSWGWAAPLPHLLSPIPLPHLPEPSRQGQVVRGCA